MESMVLLIGGAPGAGMARSLWRNELVTAQARELGMPVLSQSSGETIEDLVAAVLDLISDRHR